ncbi:MAG TPA: NAD(P)H-binding protein [Micromonosporaceae bacterium]|nr:NAD(P)H-binding protein [Micromonosporaceae bacterium]
MRVAITGGTGMLGRHVTAEFRERGHDVRVLTRRSTDHPVDLRTGEGLDAALAGCDVVVDASNGRTPKQARATLVDGGRRLLDAEQRAGVRHHVCVSIVGCDRVQFGYYRAKVEQERVVEAASVPWTIVRATQFHELITTGFAAMSRVRVLAVPTACLQTVAAADVARALADVATGAARGRRINVVGPELSDARTLARTWLSITGRRAALVPVRVPGAVGRGMRDGSLTVPDPDVRGITTYADWLRQR